MTITIINSYPNDKHPSRSYLEMSDGANSVVLPNAEVIWQVDKSNKEITSILIEDDSNTNLFVPDPAPTNDDHTEWKGTVRGNLRAGDEENYRIYWCQNDKVYCYDPKLQINS